MGLSTTECYCWTSLLTQTENTNDFSTLNMVPMRAGLGHTIKPTDSRPQYLRHTPDTPSRPKLDRNILTITRTAKNRLVCLKFVWRLWKTAKPTPNWSKLSHTIQPTSNRPTVGPYSSVTPLNWLQTDRLSVIRPRLHLDTDSTSTPTWPILDHVPWI